MDVFTLLLAAVLGALPRSVESYLWACFHEGRQFVAYCELAADLPPGHERARVWLAYLRACGNVTNRECRAVHTRDGKAAEVILVRSPSFGLALGVSVAFLRVGGRTIDVVTCAAGDRRFTHTCLLEDVDGDGALDVAFRSELGPEKDPQVHRRLWGLWDKRTWYAAYAITSKGFRSLFAETDRALPIRLECDTAGLPVDLRVTGLPSVVYDNQVYECRVELTNRSNQDLIIENARSEDGATWNDKWFQIDIGGIYCNLVRNAVLRPGETLSQVYWALPHDIQKEPRLRVRCALVPENVKFRAR